MITALLCQFATAATGVTSRPAVGSVSSDSAAAQFVQPAAAPETSCWDAVKRCLPESGTLAGAVVTAIGGAGSYAVHNNPDANAYDATGAYGGTILAGLATFFGVYKILQKYGWCGTSDNQTTGDGNAPTAVVSGTGAAA